MNGKADNMENRTQHMDSYGQTPHNTGDTTNPKNAPTVSDSGERAAEDRFSAMLALIVPAIVKEITKHEGLDEKVAITNLYKSRLYLELSDEKSKLWHYSALTLYMMYAEEQERGSYSYPEES